MKVRDIMADFASVAADTPVSDVAQLLLRDGLPGVPVVDSDGHVLGIVSRLDLVAKHARVHLPVYLGILGGIIPFDTRRTEEDLKHVVGTTARDLMDQHVFSVDADADVDDAATAMEDHRADPLLVTEGGSIVGLLTDAAIIRLLILEESGGADTAGS